MQDAKYPPDWRTLPPEDMIREHNLPEEYKGFPVRDLLAILRGSGEKDAWKRRIPKDQGDALQDMVLEYRMAPTIKSADRLKKEHPERYLLQP